ncbi:unnamed protein product [Nippostrongylus brasiliensis]|uniref:Ras-GEF domain-containing protein n=1 Tax=Nippostrongylus brasiliensis TaxID=27835 RepID=A0A0N4YYL3_NIPBR|nr:unnamed protein product [Nippostrongylus brasiliensis]
MQENDLLEGREYTLMGICIPMMQVLAEEWTSFLESAEEWTSFPDSVEEWTSFLVHWHCQRIYLKISYLGDFSPSALRRYFYWWLRAAAALRKKPRFREIIAVEAVAAVARSRIFPEPEKCRNFVAKTLYFSLTCRPGDA